MNTKPYGELVPVGGGDPIPLLKPRLIIGRRESSDIVLRFSNVSGTHCELIFIDGCWTIKDLGSSNGTKVNDVKINDKKLQSGDKICIAKHIYEIFYDSIGKTQEEVDIFSESLLKSAGLERHDKK